MSDSDDDVGILANKTKKSAFMLAMDSDSDDSDGAPAQSSAPAPVTNAASAPASAAKSGKDSKAKGKGGKSGKKADDDDDWEALLDAEAAKNGAPAPAPAAAAKKGAKGIAPAPAPAPAAAGGEDDDSEEDGAAASGAASKKKKDKRKDKKKGAAADAGSSESAAAAAAPPAAAQPQKLTAAAKLALERQAAARAAEEKARLALEEEQRRVDEENRRIEEEERRKEELRQKRLEERRLKKEAEMKAGTYKTKKQKEEIQRKLAALDKAKAAGMFIAGFEEQRAAMLAQLAEPDGGDDKEGAAAEDASPAVDAGKAAEGAAAKKKASQLYADAKKKKDAAKAASDAAAAGAAAGATQADAAVEDDWETAADTVTSPPPAAAAASGADSWDADEAQPATAAAGKSAGAAAAKPAGGAAEAAPAKKVAKPAPAPAPSQGYRSLEERIEESRLRRERRKEAALATRSEDHLRSPICVVLGHVDTGKTSLLDKIRRTNVQEGEAGGITQQIGATYFPMDRLRSATDKVNKELNLEYKIPGLLVIDTPGHEQFTNLRSRGSSLCDIAVLVVDIMAGLERQTIESLQLLRQRKTPFVVALNKVDHMYGWKANPNMPIQETLKLQPDYAVQEFETRTNKVLMQLQEQGLNSRLYYENDNFRKNVSVVPTSAHSGEGVPDLLMLIVQLTQQLMSHRLMFSPYVQATILEVKAIDGLGTTVDVVLVNGQLNEGDTIVVCGMNGPVVTQIRALLTPPPLREMRVKSDYVHHKSIEAAMGVKIVGSDLDKAVAGTELLVLHPEDEVEDLKEEVMEDFEKIMKGFRRDPVGVYVQASTLGSLEALLEYLRTHDPVVPVAAVGIGPLHKKDVVHASVMLEHRKEYATILAFDVKVTSEAAEFAEKMGVKIFTADIIYHLTDQFDSYLKEATAKKQEASLAEAVFPVICRIIPTAVFVRKDPILVGVDVLEGKLKMGTPLCVVLPDDKVVQAGGRGTEADGSVQVKKGPNVLRLGRVAGMEVDKKPVQEASPGGPSIALKIEGQNDEERAILYGRHFDHNQLLCAHISRQSIDLLKENFRDVMTKDNWKTVIKLKDQLGVE